MTSFVGRAREMEAVRRRMVEARLVTLVGPGGVGKTRLALEVAAGAARAFADGVWLVDLIGVTETRRVAGAVVEALEIADISAVPAERKLRAHLRDRHLLLVLDNCEHLLAPCAELAADLLSVAPHLRILATSREQLGIRGEHLYQVLPLPVPDPERTAPDVSYDVVALFSDRAKLAVLAKVNRGELSQRQAGAMLGVSYTWVRDMTKRYFGTEGQRITRHAEPEPEEWMPVLERVDRGEMSKRAAADELTVSVTRITTMLAHVRGEATDPALLRRAMEAKLEEPPNAELYKKRSHSIEPVLGNIKANLGYRRFTRRSLPAVNSEWHLICTAHNLLKLRQASLA